MSDTNETKPKHPLLVARDKAIGFVKGIGDAFTPTPPPPTEYRVVKSGHRPVDDEMTTLALEGWRFLAIMPDGILMGRNHKTVVEVAGEVEIHHANHAVPWNYTTQLCCNHTCRSVPFKKPEPDNEFTIPEKPTELPKHFCDVPFMDGSLKTATVSRPIKTLDTE